MAQPRKVAILGGGRIGEALLSGLLSSGWRSPDEVVVTARSEARVAELHDRHGVEATTSNPEAVHGAGLVVVAVKPQDIDALLADVGPLLVHGQTVLSVAAGSGGCGQPLGDDPGRVARVRSDDDLDVAPLSHPRRARAPASSPPGSRSGRRRARPPARARGSPRSSCRPGK